MPNEVYSDLSLLQELGIAEKEVPQEDNTAVDTEVETPTIETKTEVQETEPKEKVKTEAADTEAQEPTEEPETGPTETVIREVETATINTDKATPDGGGLALLNETLNTNYKSIEDAAKSISESKAKAAQLASELDKQKAHNPYPNKFVEELSEWVKRGGDEKAFYEVQKLDLENMSPKDAIKLQMKMENSLLSNDEIDALVDNDYLLNPDDFDEDELPKQEKLKNAQMKRDSLKAFDYLKKLKVESSVPDQEKQRQEQERQNELRMESWPEPLTNLTEGLTDLKFTIDQKGNTLAYQVSQEEVSKVAKEAMNWIQSSGISPNESGLVQAQTYMKNFLILKNIDKIVAAASNQTQSNIAKKEIEKKANASATSPELSPNIKPEEVDGIDAVIQGIERNEIFF